MASFPCRQSNPTTTWGTPVKAVEPVSNPNRTMKRPAGLPTWPGRCRGAKSEARRRRSDLADGGIGFGLLGDGPLAGPGDQEKRCRKPDKNPDDGQVERGLATGCLDGEIEGLAKPFKNDEQGDDDARQRAAGDQPGRHHGARAHVRLLGSELPEAIDQGADQTPDEDRQGGRKGQVYA